MIFIVVGHALAVVAVLAMRRSSPHAPRAACGWRRVCDRAALTLLLHAAISMTHRPSRQPTIGAPGVSTPAGPGRNPRCSPSALVPARSSSHRGDNVGRGALRQAYSSTFAATGRRARALRGTGRGDLPRRGACPRPFYPGSSFAHRLRDLIGSEGCSRRASGSSGSSRGAAPRPSAAAWPGADARAIALSLVTVLRTAAPRNRISRSCQLRCGAPRSGRPDGTVASPPFRCETTRGGGHPVSTAADVAALRAVGAVCSSTPFRDISQGRTPRSWRGRSSAARPSSPWHHWWRRCQGLPPGAYA